MRCIRTFRDLVVWRKAFELCLDVYRITEGFPDRERYGMVTELRKTARSVLYNIAEGHKRFSTLEYVRFLDIADGSAAELETQFYLSKALSYLDDQSWEMLVQRLLEVERMLAALKRSLRKRLALPPPPTNP